MVFEKNNLISRDFTHLSEIVGISNISRGSCTIRKKGWMIIYSTGKSLQFVTYLDLFCICATISFPTIKRTQVPHFYYSDKVTGSEGERIKRTVKFRISCACYERTGVTH
jgi:hypothetical protein